MTRDELMKHFSDRMYEIKKPYILRVLDECPEITDPKIVRIASGFMVQAQSESVNLAPQDAVRLAKAFKPTPIKDLVAKWNSVGINTLGDLRRVLEEPEEEQKLFTGVRSKAAVEKAEKLEYYAEALVDNPDIILLGRPTFWPEIDSAWLKLAVLCDSLSEDEQVLLKAMRNVADRCEFKMNEGIPTILFRIKNVHS